MSLIGEGSFGQVFKNGNHVVKKIKLIDANEDEPLVYSTIREVAFLKKFKHHNIIQLHDIKLEKDVVHIYLEHGGITLTKWMMRIIQQKSLTTKLVFLILM